MEWREGGVEVMNSFIILVGFRGVETVVLGVFRIFSVFWFGL